MNVYCTICCRKKNPNSNPIQAVKRYISKRIRSVYEFSQYHDVGFRILSGKYGLLKPDDRIPWYDKKLEFSDISQVKENVKQQLIEQGISEITFFSMDPEIYFDWQPYFELIRSACFEVGIPFNVILLEYD